jgi:hypothetical protein
MYLAAQKATARRCVGAVSALIYIMEWLHPVAGQHRDTGVTGLTDVFGADQ